MSLSEITWKKVDQTLAKFCDKRVPVHVRNKIRLTYEFRGDVVTLFEDRPVFNDPSRWTHSQVAQFRFEQDTLRWTLYCRDRNAKWHLYTNIQPSNSFDALIAEVDRDPTGIFWG